MFPTVCARCLKPDAEWELPVASDYGRFAGFYFFYTKHKHLQVNVPHCGECAVKINRVRSWSTAGIVAGLIVGVALAVWLDLGRFGTILLGMILCSPGIAASEYLYRAVRIKNYDDRRIVFRFKSAGYARLFETLNRRI